MDHNSTFELQLFGALKMRSPSGKDVTPRLAKTQGLLAFLALAEEQPVNRSTLQNLLWSDRMPKQGRDSLKKALSELRKCFAEAGEDPLITNGGPVRLVLSDISVDALTGQQPQRTALYDPQFLDGLDIRDECFNRWLIDIRTKLDNRPSALEQPRLASPGERIGMPSDAPFMIGILPPRHMETDEKAGHVANVLINGLQRALEQSGVFSVYDFRPSADLGSIVDRDADMFLNVDASSFDEDIFVGMKLTKVGDAKLIWNLEETIHFPDLSPRALHVRASTQVDQICEAVKNAAGFFDSGHIAARSVMGAIDHIFRLSNSNLDSAESALSSAIGLVETSTYYAWYAFLAAFQVEKLGRNNAEDIIERAESYSARALELDRNNPLTLALVSHVHSFVLRDTDRARELVGPVRHMAGQNVMLADTIAMLHFYLGEYHKAKQNAELACDLGRNNLFRYSFTTSLAMSQLMLGEHREAIANARRALAQHPIGNGHQYEPTLRTLASALSWAGDLEDGRSVLRRLDRQFGTKTLEKLKSADDAPFPNTEVFGVVRQGLESLHAD